MAQREPLHNPLTLPGDPACAHVQPGGGWFIGDGNKVVCAECYRRLTDWRPPGRLFATIAELKTFAAEQRRHRRHSRGEREDED